MKNLLVVLLLFIALYFVASSEKEKEWQW